MRNVVIGLAILASSVVYADSPSHSGEGCVYSPAVMAAYDKSLQGADRLVLFNPYISPFLEDGKEQAVLDVGCGSGIWSTFAARKGCKVYAIDYQSELVDRAVDHAGKLGLLGKISVSTDSVAHLPYRNSLFDRSISIMVGCRLPKVAFARHFRELARTLKKDGEAVIAAPNSLGVVFSDGMKSDGAILEDIHDALGMLESNSSDDAIVAALSGLSHVMSAMFAYRDGRLYLVTDETRLTSGQPIWRKVAGGVIPSFYHNETDYQKQLEAAGFTIIETVKPVFSSEGQMVTYNACHSDKLGAAYLKHPPFVLYHVQKQGKMRFVSQNKEPVVKKYWSAT